MKGLLMINLGSPDSTDVKDVKKYLDEFLMDERVIGKSYWFRWFLVKVIILNTRPKKSAKAYKKIWWKEGSPLIVLSRRLFEKVPNNHLFFSQGRIVYFFHIFKSHSQESPNKNTLQAESFLFSTFSLFCTPTQSFMVFRKSNNFTVGNHPRD